MVCRCPPASHQGERKVDARGAAPERWFNAVLSSVLRTVLRSVLKSVLRSVLCEALRTALSAELSAKLSAASWEAAAALVQQAGRCAAA